MPLPSHVQRRGPGISIRLPYLTAEEAWTVAAILEGLLDTIWRAHGAAMADYQGCVFPDWPGDPIGDRVPYGPASTGCDEPF